MTRDEILKMEAGDEMNLLVAEKVIGWSKRIPRPGWWNCKSSDYALENENGDTICPTCQIPNYSVSIEHSWEVVDKLKKEWIVTITIEQFETSVHLGKNYASKPIEITIDGETSPVAICRASLLAVMNEK